MAGVDTTLSEPSLHLRDQEDLQEDDLRSATFGAYSARLESSASRWWSDPATPWHTIQVAPRAKRNTGQDHVKPPVCCLSVI